LSEKNSNATISWIKISRQVEGKNIFAHINIKDQRLILELNSEQCLERAENEIETALGDWVEYLHAEMISPLDMLANDDECDVPMEFPKFDADQLNAIVRKMSEDWLNKPIPALDGLTPLEAAKTAQGREKLDVLLEQFEYKEKAVPDNALTFDVEYIREQIEYLIEQIGLEEVIE